MGLIPTSPDAEGTEIMFESPIKSEDLPEWQVIIKQASVSSRCLKATQTLGLMLLANCHPAWDPVSSLVIGPCGENPVRTGPAIRSGKSQRAEA